MNDFCVVYYDLLEIPVEIKSVVNINHFGSMFYKKQKLARYHEAIFKANGITHFYHIHTAEDLQRFISYHSHSNIEKFIFMTSRFTVVQPQLFSDFLHRIQYIDSSLGVFLYDEIRSFLKINKKELIDFLQLLKLDTNNSTQLIRQNFKHLEKFRLEKFYIEIENYIDFVGFLQSNFELRYFNSIESNGFTITKRSEQKTKMLAEYSYYNFVPEHLKLYFLRPFDFKESETHAEYSLERLNIPDLSVQWIHFSIDAVQLKSLMQRIFTFFIQRPSKKVSKEEVQKVAAKLYVNKLADRYASLKEKPVIHAQIDDIVRNCSSYKGLNELFEYYQKVYNKVTNEIRKNDEDIVFSHGDLCFSNILYDKRIDYIKFIDPKGCTKEEDAYMDKYYDVAKLSHSIMGHYDFINNGLYEINFENNLDVSLHIDVNENIKAYQKIFREFLTENKFDYRLVRLYEASLFLSMLPLHVDHPKKVLAFVLTAIRIIGELEREV